MSEQITPHFWEFRRRIWTGKTYADSLCLASPGFETGQREICKRHWRCDQGWGFILESGGAVLVPDTNVTFVYGEPIPVDSPGNRDKDNKGVGNQESAKHEPVPSTAGITDQNGFPVSQAQAAYAEQDNIKSLASYAESRPMPTPEGMAATLPKRRGRPPKIRPPEG